MRKDYGLAVAYCASAEDWAGLGRVVDYVLEEYVTSGISPLFLFSPVARPDLHLLVLPTGAQHFISQASAISGTMQELYTKGPSHWVFYHRFMFVSRYAQLHESLASNDLTAAAKTVVSIIRDELVPRAWGPIVLSDAIPLIRFGMLPRYIIPDIFDDLLSTQR